MKGDNEMITIKSARALGLLFIGSFALALVIEGLVSFVSSPQANTSDSKTEELQSAAYVDPFKDISLEARAAYIFDLKNKVVLFAKNENEKLPLASVTKLMTTLVARDTFSESALIVTTKDDLAAEGDSGLRPGERWRMGDLLNLMLIISSNDAAHAIASFVGANGQLNQPSDPVAARAHFIQMMNAKALSLKLDQMEFFNESGLDVNPVQNGGYGSAHNVADLFAVLWGKYPETIEITSRKDARIYSQDNIAHVLPNTDEIVGHIPGLVASKTGYTDLAGGNLAVIFDRGIGDPVVAVVLGSTYKGRFDDMQKLVDAALQARIPEKPTK